MPYFQQLTKPQMTAPVTCPDTCACCPADGPGDRPEPGPPSALDPSLSPGFSRYKVGGVWVRDQDAMHTLNPQDGRATVYVVNVGDRDIQVGSHFHLADVNEDLLFFTDVEAAAKAEAALTDPRHVRAKQIAAARELAYDRSKTPGKAPWGYRLDIAPGDSMRFSPENAPSEAIEVVPIGGRRRVPGLRKDKPAEDVALD